jgi:adenylate cyclase class IV
MAKEIEVGFYDVDKEGAEAKLHELGAQLTGKFSFKQINFQLSTSGKPGSEDYHTSWIRVRTDGSRTTLTLKEQNGIKLDGREEYEVDVNGFEDTIRIVRKLLPVSDYAYFESERLEYTIGRAKVCIDKLPLLPYLMEIEADSERVVRGLADTLGRYGKLEIGREMAFAEYYSKHGVDYGLVQREYVSKVERIFDKD